MDRIFAGIGAALALSGVVLGAFGAHGLKTRLSAEMLEVFETGIRYHMYHAFGLFAVAWVIGRWPSGAATTAGWLMLAGVIIFSGSLYILAISGTRWWGAITPIGGVALIAGWASLILAIYRAR